jgi:ligand-binding sensor domain-containing protein
LGGKEGIQVHSGHDPKDLSSFTYYYDELPDYYVIAITQATNGDIWVGTRKGISIFNGSEWETITNGLPDLYVTSIAFDKDGGAWIGTKKGLANIE